MPEPVIPQGGAPVVSAAAPATVTSVSSQETDEFVTRLIGRYGTKDAALLQLAREQLKYRKRAQSAEKERDEAKKAVPAAGAVVLTGEEAKAYGLLKDKGVTLDKVPEKLESFVKLEGEVAKNARERALQTSAGKKYDLAVLTKLIGDTPIEFDNVNQMKEDKSGIETVQVPFVVLTSTNGTKTREALDTYLDREHAAFKEVLAYKEPSGSEGETTSQERTTAPTMPKQSTGAPAKGKKETPGDVAVKRVAGQAMTPSQRRKEAAGT